MPIRKTRNVSLTPELEVFIDERVMIGRYRSASEVVRAGLRLLEDAEGPRSQKTQRRASRRHTRPAAART